MMMRHCETVAAIGVLLSLVAVPLAVGWYHEKQVLQKQSGPPKVIALTGVAKDGVWTTEEVNGLNYWWKTFSPATIRLRKGQEIRLRLSSVDVTHRFYAPALGVGPVEVEPGHTREVTLRADTIGNFKYFCTSMCGDCHFYMQGWILVSGEDGPPPEPPERLACRRHFDEPETGDLVDRGRYLYHEKGCHTCHGEGGKGGVENFNYVKDTVPAHDGLALDFHLKTQEQADAFIALLEQEKDLSKIRRVPEIPRFMISRIKYQNARELMLGGKECEGADESAPLPPLQMPAWQALLSEDDVRALMAYILSLGSREKRSPADAPRK